MVRVTIFLEGGVLPHSTVDVNTMNASNSLRESFNKLFQQVFSEEEFTLIIEPSGGYKSAAKFLKASIEKKKEDILLIDLDAIKAEKSAKLEELGLSSYSDRVFFMVQEMEAWILSQTDKIEIHAKNKGLTRKKKGNKIIDNSLLKGKHPEDIEKPSKRLKTIIREYFEEEKERRGKIKKKAASYGKLKDAPDFIELLDLKELKNTFSDVNDLILHIESKK